MHSPATAFMWGLEDNFWETALFFHHVGAEFKVRLSGLDGTRCYPLSHLIIPVFVLEARFDVFTLLTWHLHVSRLASRVLSWWVWTTTSLFTHSFLPFPLYQWGHKSSRKDRDFGLWVLAENSVWEKNGHVAMRLLISKPWISCRVYTLSLSSSS